ncbi:unnamed protein product [Anisakis simplex]|uniref:Transposase n=1 Tax=Anisakis simplex TaxID=6269 RepID=A0A0M3JGB3_ANISI|nr:unnamed protein product [Anisakis simplex]
MDQIEFLHQQKNTETRAIGYGTEQKRLAFAAFDGQPFLM